MICGIDPGKKAAYAYGLDELIGPPAGCRTPLPSRPRLWAVSAEPLYLHCTEMLVEGQDPNRRIGGGPASRASLCTLAFNAGLRLGLHPADIKYAARPNAWKAVLWPGAMKKEMFCRRIYANLHEAEPRPAVDDLDALDAIGLMWALKLATPKVLKKWLIPTY